MSDQTTPKASSSAQTPASASKKKGIDPKAIKNFAIAISLLIVVIVVLQNTESVETRVLFFSFTMPRALLLVITLVVGVIAGLLMGSRLRRNKADAAN